MLITFLENARYCENGLELRVGKKGETRNIPHSQACALVRAGKADVA